MERDNFLILPYSLPGERVSNLMGRVVLDPERPDGRFIPHGFETRDLVPDITPLPITYQNLSSIVNGAKSASLAARLTSYLAIRGDTDDQVSVSMESRVVRRYQMVQTKLVFEELMKSPALYASQLRELLEESKDGKCYLVVGFLTAESTVWTTKVSQRGSAEVGARMPIGEMTGTSPSFDLEGKMQVSRSRDRSSTGEVVETEIFAVAYNVVKRDLKFAMSKGLFHRSRPTLGREKRWKGHHLAMGSQEEDSEEEIEYDREETQKSTAQPTSDLEVELDADGGWMGEKDTLML